MTMRKKIILGLIGLVVLVAIGVLVWGIKTGKIKPRADTTGASQYSLLGQFGSPGTGPGQISFISDMAVDPTTGNIFVSDLYQRTALSSCGNNCTVMRYFYRIQVFDKTGKFLYQFGQNLIYGGYIPWKGGKIAIDKNGMVYVTSFKLDCYPSLSDAFCQATEKKFVVFNNNGAYVTSIGLNYIPLDIATDPSTGELYTLSGTGGTAGPTYFDGTNIKVYNSTTHGYFRGFPLSAYKAGNIAINGSYDIYTIDVNYSVVRRYDSFGQYWNQQIGPSNAIPGLDIDASNKIYLNSLDGIQVFDSNRNFLAQIVMPEDFAFMEIAAAKDGNKVYISNWSTVRIYGPAQTNINGTVKGQDTGSTNQIPIELAKVKTTINGKTYFARTDKDGKYTLNISDQATLPTTPITLTATSDDSYDSQDQQITVTLNQPATKDFVLGRQFSKQWVGGVTNISNYIATNLKSQNTLTIRDDNIISQAQAEENATSKIEGKVIDSDTEIPIPNAQVLLKGREDSVNKNFPVQQVATDSQGKFSFTIPFLSDHNTFFDIYGTEAWKDNEYVWSGYQHDFNWNSSSSEDIKMVFRLAKFNQPTEIGGITFVLYGKDTKNYFSDPTIQKAISNIATVIVNLEKEFKIEELKYVVIYNSSGGSANIGFKISYITINLKKGIQEGTTLSTATHEMGHLIFYYRFRSSKDQIVLASVAHWEMCPAYRGSYIDFSANQINLDTCSFYGVTESIYLNNGGKSGHPWDNGSELFASAFNIQNNFLSKFFDLMKNESYKEGSKNSNKFVMNLIESRRQQINGEKPHKSVFGLPLNLSKTYSVADILAGKYP